MPVVIMPVEDGKVKVVDVDIAASKIIGEMDKADLSVRDFETGHWIRKIKPALAIADAAIVAGTIQRHGIEIRQVTDDAEPKAGRVWIRDNTEGNIEIWKEKAKAKRKASPAE